MSADFFKGKFIVIAAVVLSLFIVTGVYLYTRYIDNAAVEAVSQSYYFLVSDSTHVEASTHQIVLNGGAGYLLETDGREYVTVSTYLTSEAAKKAQDALETDTRIITLSVDNLYFKTKREKKNAKQIKAAFQAFADCIELLSRETSRLANGGTQESCKRILETLKKQFYFLGEAYKDILPSYKELCDKAVKHLNSLMEDMIFTSDLRRVQCDLCYSYVCLAKEFSL